MTRYMTREELREYLGYPEPRIIIQCSDRAQSYMLGPLLEYALGIDETEWKTDAEWWQYMLYEHGAVNAYRYGSEDRVQETGLPVISGDDFLAVYHGAKIVAVDDLL